MLRWLHLWLLRHGRGSRRARHVVHRTLECPGAGAAMQRVVYYVCPQSACAGTSAVTLVGPVHISRAQPRQRWAVDDSLVAADRRVRRG